MRLFLLATLAIMVGGVYAAQNPPSPANPFPNHEMPPDDWFCWPANKNHDPMTDVHACTCLGMQEQPDPEHACQAIPDDEEGGKEPNDNAKCKAYCHKDHCTCITQCEGSS